MTLPSTNTCSNANPAPNATFFWLLKILIVDYEKKKSGPSIRMVARTYHPTVLHGHVLALLAHIQLQGWSTLVLACVRGGLDQLWCRRLQVVP